MPIWRSKAGEFMSAQAELDGHEVQSKGRTGPGRAAQGGGWHQGERDVGRGLLSTGTRPMGPLTGLAGAVSVCARRS